MLDATILIVSLILFSAVVISVLIARPVITATRGGKILAFVAMFCLPIFCGLLGVSKEMARSKSTTFCLSCHTMDEYGKSLYVDDPTHLPASHFQNHRVPADEACYSCHTNYAMFGGLKVKLNGLKHVAVYYLGTPPAPEPSRPSMPQHGLAAGRRTSACVAPGEGRVSYGEDQAA